MKSMIRIPVTAAALALLLAACGGGSSSDKAVSSSPTPPGSQGTTPSANAGASGSGSGATTTPGTGGNNITTPPGSGTPPGGTTTPGTDTTTPGSGSSGGTSPGSSTPPPSTTPPSTPPGNDANPPPPAPSPTPPQPVPLVSADGVRGDVLLAMLSQKPCVGAWPTPARGEDGSFLSEGFIRIVADSHMGNYTIRPDHPSTGFSNTLGCNGQDYQPVAPGAHRYHHGQTVFAKFYRTPRDFVFLHVEMGAHVGTETVTLNRHMNATGFGFQAPRFERQLQAATDYTFRLDANIPFGDVHQWTAPNPADASKPQFDRLMLLKEPGDRDVRLCWNTDLVEVKRLQCMLWRIPQNWTAGSLLTNLDQTLVEDRSVYPGETGLAYWD